jgi:hypothetical protein
VTNHYIPFSGYCGEGGDMATILTWDMGTSCIYMYIPHICIWGWVKTLYPWWTPK